MLEDVSLLYTLNQVVLVPENIRAILRRVKRDHCTTYKIACAILGKPLGNGDLPQCERIPIHGKPCYCKRHSTGIHLLEVLELKGKPDSRDWPALLKKLFASRQDMEFFAPTIREVLNVTFAAESEKFVFERLAIMTWGLGRRDSAFEVAELALILQLAQASLAAAMASP